MWFLVSCRHHHIFCPHTSPIDTESWRKVSYFIRVPGLILCVKHRNSRAQYCIYKHFLTVTIHPGDKKKYIIKTDEHSLAWTAIVSIFRGGTVDESLDDARRS